MATGLDNLIRIEPPLAAAVKRPDRIDLRILSRLQKDGSLSIARLAEAVGLSATPCRRRLRRLEAEGYILSRGTRIDTARLGTHLLVLTEIVLKSRLTAHVQPFERYVASREYFLDCYAVTGDFDYVLRVVARDVAHYYSMMEELTEHCAAVARYSCTIALRTVKHTTDIPISLFDDMNVKAVDDAR
ncbi:Lrp/AsnC family transcriptional regulator [Hoeflea sp. G2-23]|uniref:Lrp/AsnC family transcriptional regulator n=1 Tax=Hoeflea algicola TaxID=2983763 RepID=A0ABT3ZD88_9HYPH|nr:Lrp/AsnC family transcriptional regulator [Hoeflea algicola]MCY0149613.1 Lrp/AsnC family transcriptional regulator [Hoeflea algicola]